MPFATGGNARIRTNISAENAYNILETANRDISLRQLRLSTGKRINNAADDVAGYITSKALLARNGSLKSALNAVGDAYNITNILMDSLDSISQLLTRIKDSAATASSGAMGTDEKVALSRAAYRMAEQIQTVVDTSVFGGQQLLDGSFSADFVIGSNAKNELIYLNVDVTTNNAEMDIPSHNFNVNALGADLFAGISGLDLTELNAVDMNDLGIFSREHIGSTLSSLANAIQNVTKVASYIGGIANRLAVQEDVIKSQITNYNAAISRLEDSDIAKEQLELIKSQFLQQTSITSLAQANQNPQVFLQLIRG